MRGLSQHQLASGPEPSKANTRSLTEESAKIHTPVIVSECSKAMSCEGKSLRGAGDSVNKMRASHFGDDKRLNN